MKRKLLFIISTVSVMTAYGSSIDHIQTYAPEYVGNQAQNALINNVSGYYNPAGLPRLEQGKYINLGLQYARGHEKMSYKGKEHKAELRQVIPNLAFYSVDPKGACFITFGGIAGGGKLTYPGVSGLDVAMETLSTKVPVPFQRMGVTNLGIYDKGSTVTGKNMYEHLTFGRAFIVDEKLSVSVAGRVIHGTRELVGNLNIGLNPKVYNPTVLPVLAGILPSDLKADIDVKREAWGYGFQVGLNYKVNEKLNVSARYDSRIKLNFKAKGDETLLASKALIGTDIGFTSFYPQYTKGQKIRRDLPAILALGASYQLTDKWIVATSGNFYFNKQVDIDKIEGHSAHYKNGWEIAVGNEYQLNDKWTLTGGINYAKTGAPKSSYGDVEYALNSTMLGVGLRYQYDGATELTASIGHFIYQNSEGNFIEKHGVNENQKYHKSISAFGLGITKKF